MNIITKYFKVSKAIIASMGLMFAFALVFLLQVSQSKAYTFPDILVGQDLKVGSTGQNVVMLQSLMSELGYLDVPDGVPFGYYGPLTQDSVAKYQASLSVSPTAGYYGPLTKVAMQSDFASHGWLSLLGW